VVSDTFLCVKNQGASRIWRADKGIGGIVVRVGILTPEYCPFHIFDTDEYAGVRGYFAQFLADTMFPLWNYSPEFDLFAADHLWGDKVSAPMPGESLIIRCKSGVFTPRFSYGDTTISTTGAEEWFDDWITGQHDFDLPDADETDLCRTRPYNGTAV